MKPCALRLHCQKFYTTNKTMGLAPWMEVVEMRSVRTYFARALAQRTNEYHRACPVEVYLLSFFLMCFLLTSCASNSQKPVSSKALAYHQQMHKGAENKTSAKETLSQLQQHNNSGKQHIPPTIPPTKQEKMLQDSFFIFSIVRVLVTPFHLP